MSDQIQVRVVISGEVQGVWFRAWTCRVAAALGLNGWVRNRADGTVEAVFQGDQTAVEEMLRQCKQGPPRARVNDLWYRPDESRLAPGFHQAADVSSPKTS